MKQYKFEITISEEDVAGDEFWEDVLKEDTTGIKPLTETLKQIIIDSNLVINSIKNIDEIVKLVSYENNNN